MSTSQSIEPSPARPGSDGAARSSGQPDVGRPGAGGSDASQSATTSGNLVAMSFPGARRIAGWLFWVVFPALCLAAVSVAIVSIASHVGSGPAGIRGSFVVAPRSCGQGICSFGGSFTSDDGSIRNLPLLGDPRWHVKDVHQVTFDPQSVEVTAMPGHWDPTPAVLAAIGAVTYLGLLGSLVRGTRRDRQD